MSTISSKRIGFAAIPVVALAAALLVPAVREPVLGLVSGPGQARNNETSNDDGNGNATSGAGDAAASGGAPTIRRATRLPVAGIEIARGPFILTVRASGRAEAPRRVELSPRVSERVTAVHVTEGDHVRKGKPLLDLDARPFEIALNEAKARQASAEVDYRVNLLAEDGSAARPFADVAFGDTTNGTASGSAHGESDTPLTATAARRREFAAHRSGYTEATQQVARAELDLEGTRITAPMSGEIAAVDAVVGGRVQANQPVLTLVDLARLRVPAEVLESDFARLETGARATLRFAGFPDRVYTGVVSALSPECDPETGTGIAYIELENEDREIRPGMYADVEIRSASYTDRLSVPRRAILERDRKLLVFRATAGRAEWQYVSTGLESEDFIEITDGIAPGDTVLVGGHLTLAHGAPIRVKLEPSRAPRAASDTDTSPAAASPPTRGD